MKVINPVAITAAMILSASISEPSGNDPVAWNASTAYTVGQLAYRSTTHRIYKRLVAGTTATPPENDLTGTTPNWQDYLPTNLWAPFDQQVNTQAIGPSPLTFTIAPGVVCDSIALLELIGNQATITVTSVAGGGTVYSATINLQQSNVTDWYQYFFEPFSQRGGVVLTNLPPYLDAQITVTVTGTGTVALGGLVVGTDYSLGGTQYGVQAGIFDYSQKNVDATTGVVSLAVGKFRKLMNAQLRLDAGAVNAVQTLLYSLRGRPVVWIGDDSGTYDALIVFGFYRNFQLTIDLPGASMYSLNIEGMT